MNFIVDNELYWLPQMHIFSCIYFDLHSIFMRHLLHTHILVRMILCQDVEVVAESDFFDIAFHIEVQSKQ